MKKNRKLIGLLGIIIVLVLVLVLILANSHKASVNTSQSGKTSKLKTLTLDKLLTITFPCTTHAVDLKPAKTTGITGQGADCGIKVNNTKQSVVFTAAIERYTNQPSEEQSVLNYCTAKTSYPGPINGSTIYIMDPITQNYSNTIFKECTLSIDNTTAYESTARASIGPYGIILNVDSSSETTASSLENYLHNFMYTMHIK